MPLLLILIAGGGLLFVALTRLRRTSSAPGLSTSIAGARNVAELHELAMLAAAAIAAANDEPLDFTDASIDRLVPLLQYDRSRTERDDAMISESFIKERILVLGGYVGELLVRNHGGAWNIDPTVHPLPFVEFTPSVRASPFDLVRAAWESGGGSIEQMYEALIAEVREASKPTTVLQIPSTNENSMQPLVNGSGTDQNQ